jgi:pantoate ligase / CMP/dCMP kinase
VKPMKPVIIALDGPAGSGKSTVAKAVAQRLGIEHLDTGAMYRSVAWKCTRDGISLSDVEAMTRLAESCRVSVGADAAGRQIVTVDGVDVTTAIRTPEIDQAVGPVAAAAPVRAALVAQQRRWGSDRGAGVMEGRDIATVVFPDAPVKVYLTASTEERARRRSGQSGGDVASVQADIQRRDHVDSTREADPLQVAEGATLLDTTGLSVEEVVDRIVAMVPMGELGSALGAGASNTPVALSDRSAVPAVSGPQLTRFERGLYGTVHLFVRQVVRFWIVTTYTGLEHVPPTGAYIVAPNHRSVVDFMLVGPITRRRLRYLGKDSVWEAKWFVPIADGLGGIPVSRGSVDRASMNRCIEALQGGEPLVLFPEGARKSGPVVQPLFDGVSYIAIKADVPVLPVGIGGSEAVMPKGSWFPRRRRVSVIVGQPIPPPDPDRSVRKTAPELTAKLHDTVQQLFDQACEAADFHY